MNFKQIKYIPNFNKYEMGDDGFTVRDRTSKIEVAVDRTSLKALLTSDDGAITKLHGLKTLYWNSWNKTPSMYPKKIEKPALQKKSEKVSLIAKSKQLMSGAAQAELQEKITKKLSRKGNDNAHGLEIYDGKTTSIRTLLHNENADILLVRVYSQNWRDGFWFFNLKTGAVLKFEKKIHQPVYGSNSVIWPKL